MKSSNPHAETSPQTQAGRMAVLEGRVGTVFADRYRLRRLLGHGGLSAVYEAVQAPLDRVVALKLMRGDDATSEHRSLFEREASIVSRLRHPNNVTLHDFGVSADGALFLVMERVGGQSLADALADRPGRRLAVARAVSIVGQICDALGEAHELGIVHRDLKPANIMLDRLGDAEMVKVIDYGIAVIGGRQESEGEEGDGAIFGTPEYMSPEQVLGRPLDDRADIYALGAVLFEMLTGQPPFVGRSASALLMDHVSTRAPAVDELVPAETVPAPLVSLVARMLAKAPDARPQTVGEVRAALDAVKADHPDAEAPVAPRDDGQIAAARARLDRLRSEGAAPTRVRAALDALLKAKRRQRAGHKLHPGMALGGRYTLGSVLGRGGFATVWSAWDELDDRKVAVKVLHGQWTDDRTRRERFFRGARQMTALEHPGIVRVLDPECRDGAWYFFVMEHVAGGDLAAAVRQGRLDGPTCVRRLGQVADALEAAHAAGVVHRDVKPSNILVGDDGALLLTDFDLVRAPDTTGGTRTGALGTFLFAAPEVLESAKGAGPAADQYGLAMTMAFALHGDDLPSWTLRRPERLLRELPCEVALQRVLRRGLSFNAAERFPTTGAFYRAAAEALARAPGPAATGPLETIPAVAAVEPATPHRPALMRIPAGTVSRGSPDDEADRFAHEGPQHDVFVSRPFLMAATPVTLTQYAGLTGHRPTRSRNGDAPVRKLTWYEAVAYCNALSGREGLTPAYAVDGQTVTLVADASGYRLPTEAEWEHACRAGTRSRFWSGDAEADLDRVGWYARNSSGKVQSVGLKPANAWGLHDMHGNVFEWCWDWMGDYRGDPETDPLGPVSGQARVIRGGSCWNDAAFARSAYRIWRAPDARFPSLGFRVVRADPG